MAPSAPMLAPVAPPSLTSVAVTSAGAKAAPLFVSLLNTVAVAPPVVGTGAVVKSSATAFRNGSAAGSRLTARRLDCCDQAIGLIDVFRSSAAILAFVLFLLAALLS